MYPDLNMRAARMNVPENYFHKPTGEDIVVWNNMYPVVESGGACCSPVRPCKTPTSDIEMLRMPALSTNFYLLRMAL